jgi:hypothetical protein
MSVQERLNKSTVQFLKIAHHVVFARNAMKTADK